MTPENMRKMANEKRKQLVEDSEFESPSDSNLLPLTIDDSFPLVDTPLHAVSWKDESHPMWVKIKTVMDSGAAESVAPPTMAPRVSISESPGSKNGQHYVSASAGRLPNMGQ